MKTKLLTAGYFLIVTLAVLGLLEIAARMIGLGDPIVYYNTAWGGMQPLPDQKVERIGDATVTIDEKGYRTAHPDQHGALRILYLGDSVTWGGTSIDDSEVFTEISADVLRKDRPVYAMNAGVNGTGLVNHAERFLHVIKNDSVDALVWLFPWGDVWRTYATVGYLYPVQYKPRFALVEAVDHLILNYWIPAFREMPEQDERYHIPRRPVGYEVLFDQLLRERQRKNLDAARTVVAEAHRREIPVVMGVTPYLHDGTLDRLPPDASRFLDEMDSTGVNIFDASTALQQGSGDVRQLYIDTVHFTTAGHRRIGQALGQLLVEILTLSNPETGA